jgi:hypothetical protein
MKRCVLFALLLPILLCTSCGDKDLILTVDLLSYVDPAYISTEYGPISPGTPTTVIDLIEVEANLLSGVDDATELKSATLKVGADFVNETGSATGSLKIFIASADTPEPFSTTPVADVEVTLQPSHTTTISEEIPITPELLDVLTSDEAWFAVRLSYNTEGSPGDLQGVVTLTELTAVLVTKTDL